MFKQVRSGWPKAIRPIWVLRIILPVPRYIFMVLWVEQSIGTNGIAALLMSELYDKVKSKNRLCVLEICL